MTSIAKIADAVAAEISAGIASGFWPAMKVERAYLHQFKEEDATVHCAVTPANRSVGLIARGIRRALPQIAISISQRVPDSSNTAVDPLVQRIVEPLQDYYAEPRDLPALGEVRLTGNVSQDVLFDPRMLYEESLFVSTFGVELEAFHRLAAQFTLTGLPSNVTEGTVYTITVEALDSAGHTVEDYRGVVAFTSDDPGATLPPFSTLLRGQLITSVSFSTSGPHALSIRDISGERSYARDGL